jgi:hypothetical protein
MAHKDDVLSSTLSFSSFQNFRPFLPRLGAAPLRSDFAPLTTRPQINVSMKLRKEIIRIMNHAHFSGNANRGFAAFWIGIEVGVGISRLISGQW